MASKLKFYYDLMSQPSRALYMFFKLSNIPHQGIPVALRKGEHLADEFKEVNRFKLVPCIIDDDFKLSESVAIVRYLADKYEVPDNLYPKDLKRRALVDEYLEWQHLNTRLGCAHYFRLQLLLPMVTGKASNEQDLKVAAKTRDLALDKIEKIWLADHKFIVGNELSVADLFAACEIEQTRCAGYNPSKGRPRMETWLELVKKSSEPFYSEAHNHIENFGKKVKL